jgi:hypothetical protein
MTVVKAHDPINNDLIEWGDFLPNHVFGLVQDEYLIAYSGHNFLVDKDQLYDPINKVPVNEVKLSDFNLCKFPVL